MKRNFITLYFSVVLLGTIDVVLGLRFEQLVKFSCEICTPDLVECCVGTVIHKDVILTTSYCATSCQSIHKYARIINIVKAYKQPRMESKSRHDIALVIVNIDWKLRWTAKLSSVDTLSAIGLKAYYPYMDDGNTRMRETIIATCGKPGQNVYGHHVCGPKIDDTSTTKKCFQRQGVPLILNGKIMAITAATNNKLCNDKQIVFNTIDSELAWINSTIAELYPDDRSNEIEPEPAQTVTATYPSYPAMSSPQTPTSTTEMTIITYNTTTSPTTQESTAALDPIPTRTPIPEESSTLDQSEMIKPLNDETIDTEEQRLLTDHPFEVSSITEKAFSIFSTQTDAMEWFNQKVRSKLKSGNRSYFVLTTVKRVFSTPFVDLTV